MMADMSNNAKALTLRMVLATMAGDKDAVKELYEELKKQGVVMSSKQVLKGFE